MSGYYDQDDDDFLKNRARDPIDSSDLINAGGGSGNWGDVYNKYVDNGANYDPSYFGEDDDGDWDKSDHGSDGDKIADDKDTNDDDAVFDEPQFRQNNQYVNNSTYPC